MRNKTTISKRNTRHTKNKTKSGRKKNYTPKGELSAGMAYMILAILIIVAGGSLMTGSIIPNPNKSPNTGQPVITIPAQTKPAKNNLQLFTFPGATYTPTPSPTPTPKPTPNPTDTGPGGGNKQPGGGGPPPTAR